MNETEEQEISSLREEALYWRTKFEQLSYHVQALFQESTRLAAYQPPRARSAAARAIRSAALSTEERDTIRQNINLRDKAFRLEGDVANAEEKLGMAERRIQDLERQVSELKLRLVVGFQAAVSGVESTNVTVVQSSDREDQKPVSDDNKGRSSNDAVVGKQGEHLEEGTPASSGDQSIGERVLVKAPNKTSSDIIASDNGSGDQPSEFRRGGGGTKSSRTLPQVPASPAPRLSPVKSKTFAAAAAAAEGGGGGGAITATAKPLHLVDGERLIGAQNYLLVKSSVLKVQAVARGWLTRRRLATGGMLHRGSVVLELLNTERNYVDDLRTILRDYACPLAAGLSSSTSASAASAAALAAASAGALSTTDGLGSSNPGLVCDLRRLFSPLEVILLYNENFLEALEQRVQLASWFPASARVGDVVAQFADFLRCYVNYVTNFGQSLAVLAKCRQNSLFRRLERECDQRVIDRYTVSDAGSAFGPALGLTGSVVGKAAAAAVTAASGQTSVATNSPRDKSGQRLPTIRRSAGSGRAGARGSYGGASAPSGPQLNSLLIKPIQRIPRYVLLLRELIKVTPKDLRDYSALTGALSLMEAVGDKLNESKRDAESFAAVVHIYNVLVPKEAEIADLVQPHRRFLREGAVRWWRDQAVGGKSSDNRGTTPRSNEKNKQPTPGGESTVDPDGSDANQQWPSDSIDPTRVEHAECRLFLFNDCLIIARAKRGPGGGAGDVVGDAAHSAASQQLAAALGSLQTSSSSSALPSFQVLAYVNLRHVTSVVPIPDDADAGLINCFILDTPHRSLSLLAETPDSRSVWIENLSDTVSKLKSNLETLKMID